MLHSVNIMLPIIIMHRLGLVNHDIRMVRMVRINLEL